MNSMQQFTRSCHPNATLRIFTARTELTRSPIKMNLPDYDTMDYNEQDRGRMIQSNRM